MCKLKSLFLVALLFVAVGASAQLSFGVKAGLNMSNITDLDDSDMKIGYKVGPTVEYAFAPNMSIQSGLLLSSKGAKWSDSYTDEYEGIDVKVKEDITIDANYLELPICFAYKYAIAPDTKIYVNAGPYLAFGIFGKTKHEATASAIGISESGEVKYDTFKDYTYENEDGDEETMPGMEKFDFGLTFGIGMEVTKFNFGLNYDLGLTKVYDVNGISPKNSNFWISVGYNF